MTVFPKLARVMGNTGVIGYTVGFILKKVEEFNYG